MPEGERARGETELEGLSVSEAPKWLAWLVLMGAGCAAMGLGCIVTDGTAEDGRGWT